LRDRDRERERQRQTETERERQRETERQRDRDTERQRERERERAEQSRESRETHGERDRERDNAGSHSIENNDHISHNDHGKELCLREGSKGREHGVTHLPSSNGSFVGLNAPVQMCMGYFFENFGSENEWPESSSFIHFPITDRERTLTC
jgi:hypothetical protein